MTEEDRTSTTWPGDLVFAGTVAALSALLIARVFPALLDGLLVDTDSYMRLVRVRRLAETGAWFDGGLIPRANAPYGSTLHWTRPVDVLILLGGWLLTPLLGFEGALHVSGVVLSPTLLVVVCFTTAWAVRPVVGAGMRYYTMIAVLAQVGIMGYALPGRADHHILILLAFVAMIGSGLRMLAASGSGEDRPGRRALRWGWASGAWAAFGLWVSTEFLVPLALLLGVLALVWLIEGPSVVAKARAAALGFLLVTTAAVLLEHGPAGWLVAEYDRISVVHLLLAVLLAGFWTGAGLGFVTRARATRRMGYLMVGGLLVAALLGVVYPDFFRGPMADVHPELKRSWLPLLTEYQPYLVPRSVSDVGRILAYLGHALLALGVASVGLVRGRRSDRFRARVLLGAGLLVFLPLGIRWVRFVPYAEILGVLGTIVLLDRVLAHLGDRLEGLRRAGARVLTTAGILAGPLLLGAVVMGLGGEVGGRVQDAGATQVEACPVEALIARLTDPVGLGDRSRTVLAHVDLGPILLYRTPHSVVATPYHRNDRGILDTRRIMAATDPDVARRLIADRGVDVVVPCGFQVASLPESGDGEPFVSRLRRGQAPPWLEARSVRGRGGESTIFEVVSEAGGIVPSPAREPGP